MMKQIELKTKSNLKTLLDWLVVCFLIILILLFSYGAMSGLKNTLEAYL